MLGLEPMTTRYESNYKATISSVSYQADQQILIFCRT